MIAKAIIGFCQFARENGLNAGIEETFDSLKAARTGAIKDKEIFKFSLRALMCSSKEEFDLFESLFQAYWERKQQERNRPGVKKRSRPHTVEHASQALLMMADEGNAAAEEEGKSVSGASALERLRKTDFSKLSQSDLDRLEKLAQILWKQMSMRLTRRLKTTSAKEQLHLRRTIRRSIHYGGEPIELSYKGKRRRKPRLMVLLDVSGSMDQYSFFLLKFVFALQKNFERVESFVFSTRLLRITEAMKTRQLSETLQTLSEQVDSWSSGTRIGECLREFNQTYAKRVLSRNSLVVILSDGLDTGDPAIFKTELMRIKRRTKKLIWLNPLLGMDNYQPITRGLSAALPFIDIFVSAHNLDSLLALDRYLINV